MLLASLVSHLSSSPSWPRRRSQRQVWSSDIQRISASVVDILHVCRFRCESGANFCLFAADHEQVSSFCKWLKQIRISGLAWLPLLRTCLSFAVHSSAAFCRCLHFQSSLDPHYWSWFVILLTCWCVSTKEQYCTSSLSWTGCYGKTKKCMRLLICWIKCVWMSTGGVNSPKIRDSDIRIFVALFSYEPATMSPNPDAAEEELPFSEGQIIKVCLCKTQIQPKSCLYLLKYPW